VSFKFSSRSLKNLEDVHPDLVKVLTGALDVSDVDFTVIEGVRTGARQHALFLAGKTKLDFPTPPGSQPGRHLTGHAVDFMGFVNGVGTFDEKLLGRVANAVKIVALHLKIPIICGIDYPLIYKTDFVDADHIELDRTWYPEKPLIS
jgi:peptidoglycan L-alanyl-D-glutamate endopeptidase CwlK